MNRKFDLIFFTNNIEMAAFFGMGIWWRSMGFFLKLWQVPRSSFYSNCIILKDRERTPEKRVKQAWILSYIYYEPSLQLTSLRLLIRVSNRSVQEFLRFINCIVTSEATPTLKAKKANHSKCPKTETGHWSDNLFKHSQVSHSPFFSIQKNEQQLTTIAIQ